MNIPSGKHADRPVDWVVLRAPEFIHRDLSWRNLSPELQQVAGEAHRLIDVFDRKPFVASCCTDGCERPVTRGSLYAGNLSLHLWCEECSPYSAGASIHVPDGARDKLQVIRRFRDVTRYVDTFCGGKADDLNFAMKSLGEAKGVPEVVTNERAVQFFR